MLSLLACKLLAMFHHLLLAPMALAISYKTSTGNYLLDQVYDNKFPATAILEGRSGAAAGPDNAAGGTLGFTFTLPSTPWNAAASKAKTKNGAWATTGSNTVTLAHYRLKNAADTEREEGTITATGGGGDMTVDNTSLTSGQNVTINSFTTNAP